MPAGNADRQHNKRELDRAKGNIAWTIQHIQTVYDAFYGAAMELSEAEQDVPENYITTMTALDEVSKALLLIGQTVEDINNTI